LLIEIFQVTDSGFEGSGTTHQNQDEAAILGDVGGGQSNDSSQMEVGGSPRLLLVSTKIRNSVYFRHSIKPNVIFVQYKYDSMTTEGILGKMLFLFFNFDFNGTPDQILKSLYR
jgi:hypothetical protein